MNEESGMVKSVVKAFAALDFVVESCLTRSGVGLSEIAAALSIQPTTARNILKTMEAIGYIARTSDRLYVPGPNCSAMNRTVRLGARLVSVMRPALETLTRQAEGVSFVVATLYNGRRQVLLRCSGDAPIVVETRNAERGRSAYELISTRVLLAFSPDAEVEQFLEQNGLPGDAWDGIDNRERLKHSLDALRRNGFGEVGDSCRSVYAAALPIYAGNGDVVGALGVFFPYFRLTMELKKMLLSRIREQLECVREKL